MKVRQSIPSKATFSSRAAGYFPQILETIRQILRDINGHDIPTQLSQPQEPCPGDFQDWKIAWGGWLLQALSLVPGWPDKEMVFLDWGNTCLIAPYMPKRDPVDSLYVHCDLAADARAVGNVRNCLLHAVPVEGYSCQVMCYKPWWLDRLDWLPMCWTELKDVHLLMMNSHDQKVPCEGGVFSVKLLTRQRANTFRSERERERKGERHGNVHHTVRKRLVTAGPWPQQCRLRDVPPGHSFAQGPGAVGWHAPSQWCAQGGRTWSRLSRTASPPWWGTSCSMLAQSLAQPGSARLQPSDTSAWSPAGGPTSNLAMETSSPDKVCHKWVPHARLVRMSL